MIITCTANAQQNVLDSYIQQAFKTNQNLRQQQFQLDKSVYALKEAKSLFLPNVKLLGDYTRSEGGRTIDFPVGDLLNPVYTTLNQLSGENKFPRIDNARFQLNPDNFYDAKFRTSLPLINAEIWYNQQIKKEMIGSQQAAVNVYKRELAKEIKTAYYQYYQAGKAVDIYNNALSLVNENIRVNESMLRNGVRNSTALTRAQTEKQKTEAAIDQAKNNRKNAQAYFNFLLNRPLTEDITMDTTVFTQDAQLIVNTGNTDTREELQQLQKAQSISSLNHKLQQSYIIPRLSTFLDLGSQGFNWKFDNTTRYYMWGVNLQWDLFSAGKNHYKAQQAAIDTKSLQAQYSETEQSLRLQLEQATNNYNTAVANYHTAQTQLQLAQKYYTDQFRIYKEGQLLYLELVDAQNQLTSAQLQSSVAFANVQIALASLERITATYPINTNNN
jgi:outer membrane protein TolC